MLMAADQMQEAWNRISQWYRHVIGRQAQLPRESLDRIMTEREDIYRCRPPEGLPVPILVTPAEVEDRIPLEVDIEQAVRDLKRRTVGGPSGMRVE